VESDGSTASAGLSLTYAADLGNNWFASPFASVDYNSLDVSRVVALSGRDPIALIQQEEGVTGTAGLTLQRLFGGGGSAAGLYGAFVTTSNSSALQRGTWPSGAAPITRFAQGEGSSDSWAEYGATASVALGRGVSLDAAILRTAGFPEAEITTVSAGLAIDF
jgi:hypothetical protein